MTYKSDNAAISVNANGKVSVRAKYVGKANITIRSQSGGGYEAASKKIVIKINPSKTSLSCVSNMKGLKVKAVWKKNISGSGYQLQYSTSKTFAGSNKSVLVSGSKTQSKIIGNLKKGKTYYIRMRTYKVVNGTKFYASWSGAKKVMIRK